MEVNQFLPSMCFGDAVSNDAINIRKILRENGFKSEIFVKYIHPDVAEYAYPLYKYKKNPDDIVLYHFSLAGGEVTDYIKGLPGTKGLIYHNITPPDFFRNYDQNLTDICTKGLQELKTLAPFFSLGIGDSEYNRFMLEKNGFDRTTVLPIIMDWDALIQDKEKNVGSSWEKNHVNLLFVGRVAPNKKIEDLIRIFYYYQKSINPDSTLFLVGNEQVLKYSQYLKELTRALGLEHSVIFTGQVSDKELHIHYKKADVYLCMSEHEGFCVPLLEAMHYDIPIIAYNSTAIPYTLGNSGVLINSKNYPVIAELIDIIIKDGSIRQRLIKKQRERLDYFNTKSISEQLLTIVADLSHGH